MHRDEAVGVEQRSGRMRGKRTRKKRRGRTKGRTKAWTKGREETSKKWSEKLEVGGAAACRHPHVVKSAC